ncbi:cilia- and flagella-associated protein 97 [Bombina bombina]|uniref:cilia- and flagella-associated protein 97 n=1 Tax=Bombina bombina TaxID=8345 RepID=UPI00235A5B31|nr:cilia- and flagella-associated protein 97 [Bombina bombina]
MDLYANLSDDGEVDHSFFDSDVDEEVKQESNITSGVGKQEERENKNGSCLKVKEDISDEMQGSKNEVNDKDREEKQVYDNIELSSSATARPASAIKSGRSSVQSLRIEAVIPTGIPKIRREFEDNYYPDEDDSSDEERPNLRPKTAKQTNIGKKSTGKYNRNVTSSISSSDTEYSDTGTDDGTSKLSYQSSKESGSTMHSPERKLTKPTVNDLRDYGEESEDTVTDVTPLSTPDISPIQSFDLAAAGKIQRQGNVSQEVYDSDDKSTQKTYQDAMELNQLLKAFMHIDKKEQTHLDVEQPVTRHKKNFSFSNEEVRHIDRENQRLLRELSRQAAKPRNKNLTPKKPCNVPTRLYHTALNRQREQQRIERENMALLKRLESVKPTVGMTRSEQFLDYQRQAGYLSSTASSPRPGKASVSRLSPSSSGAFSRVSSASSQRSDRIGSSAALLRPTKSRNVRAAWM